MSKLIVTLDRISDSKRVKQFVGKNEVNHLLPLWPNEWESELFESDNVLNTNSYLDRINHTELAGSVVHFSGEWWAFCKANEEDLEPSLNGLKVTQIFRYEFEQVFTKLLTQLQIIEEVLEELNPTEVIFLSNLGKKTNADSASVLDIFSFIQFECFFESKYSWIKFIDHRFKSNKKPLRNNEFIERLKFIKSKGFNYLAQKIKQRYLFNSWEQNAIIINNSNRCLDVFINELPDDESVQYLHNVEVSSVFPITHQSFELKKDVYFKNLNLNDFFDWFFKIIEFRFYNLKQEYLNLQEEIKRFNPKIFITVTMASSTDLVKVWAFKESGVRTVWSSEGLGQPNPKTQIVFDAVFHPEVDIERWVFSKLFGSYFNKTNNLVIVTGYFGGMGSKKIEKVGAGKSVKKVCLALASANPYVGRAIEGEDFFEILDCVKQISEVVGSMHNVELIVKLHPGDAINKPIYEKVCERFNCVTIEPFGNLNQIIQDMDLMVIYNTSVGIESLLMNKNVICFNYLQRETYITGLQNFVNNDPSKGPALIFANDQTQLKYEMEKVLYSNYNAAISSDLSFILENANTNYTPRQKVEELFIG